MPLIETRRGHTWFVEEAGEGPRIFFIHGWSADSRIWIQQRRCFSERFHVLAVDLPGHGQTPWQDLSLADMAEDFLEILFKGDKDPVNVVGSSFGGLVALKMMEKAPALVSSLSLVGSQPRFSQAGDYPWGLSEARVTKLRQQISQDYPSILPVFFRSLFTPQERASERFKWLQGFRASTHVPPREALLRLLEILLEADLREVLRRISVPLQFINGTQDPICPRELYLSLQNELRFARFDWMEGCGHFPFVSCPEEFNQILDGFLKGALGPGTGGVAHG